MHQSSLITLHVAALPVERSTFTSDNYIGNNCEEVDAIRNLRVRVKSQRQRSQLVAGLVLPVSATDADASRSGISNADIRRFMFLDFKTGIITKLVETRRSFAFASPLSLSLLWL